MDPHAQPPARGEVAAKPSVARAPYYSRRPGWRNWSDAIGLNPIVLRGVWVRVPPRAYVEAFVSIRLQPRAKRDEVVGERGDAIVVRVAAPPVDGKANAALCAFIARTVGTAPARVSVVRGQTSREKVVRVAGVAPADVRAALLD